MAVPEYGDIVLEIKGRIGIIKFNRPKSLNSFGGNLIAETIDAFRRLNEHPTTVFTVLTGEGRFFSAGADIRSGELVRPPATASKSEIKVSYITRFAPTLELLRSIINHKKVFVLALNGPGVGGGAAWFPGLADVVVAASGSYLQVPFSALGLIPEAGSAVNIAQSIGVHRAFEFLVLGRKMTVAEMEGWGLVTRVLAKEGFQDSVVEYLEELLSVNDGGSLVESKRLMTEPLREGRLLAVWNAVDALAERFVDGAPLRRFEEKKRELEAKSKKTEPKL